MPAQKFTQKRSWTPWSRSLPELRRTLKENYLTLPRRKRMNIHDQKGPSQ